MYYPEMKLPKPKMPTAKRGYPGGCDGGERDRDLGDPKRRATILAGALCMFMPSKQDLPTKILIGFSNALGMNRKSEKAK